MGWSSPVARQAHNLKVVGSNPIPATKNMNNNQKNKDVPISRYEYLSNIKDPTDEQLKELGIIEQRMINKSTNENGK